MLRNLNTFINKNINCYNSKNIINISSYLSINNNTLNNNNIIREYAKKNNSKAEIAAEREQNEVQFGSSVMRTIKTNSKSNNNSNNDDNENNKSYNNNNNRNENKIKENKSFNRNDRKDRNDRNNRNNRNDKINKFNKNNKNEKWYKNVSSSDLSLKSNNNKNNKINNKNKNNKEMEEMEEMEEIEQYYDKIEENEEFEEFEENENDEELDEKYKDYKVKQYQGEKNNEKITLSEINKTKREESTITGLVPILEIFKKRKQDIVKLVIDNQFYNLNKKYLHPILKYFISNNKAYKLISDKDSNEQLKKMSGTIHHGGIMAIVKRKYPVPIETLIEMETERVKIFESTPSKSHSFSQHLKNQELVKQKEIETLGSGARPIIVFLDGVENPMNLGAISRTCALFGVKSIIINNSHSKDSKSLNPFSGESYRSSRGAVEHTNISLLNTHRETMECLNEFVSKGWELIVTSSYTNNDHKNITLYSKGSNKLLGLKPMVIVFGSESKGIIKQITKLATHSLTIPGTGLIESLNVAQAASVILAECWRIQGKTLESPNKKRVDSIKSGNFPLEITPEILGIKDEDIYNDQNNQDVQDGVEDYNEDYDENYQVDDQYKR